MGGNRLPDKRSHHGKHPRDDVLFAPDQTEHLRQAVADLSWLLSHGYAEKSSLKLVGDRYALCQRQRTAVMRCACSDTERAHRRSRRLTLEALAHRPLLLDGYNIITTLETALAGGVILTARDGAFRDIAGIHGTYRKVEETVPALEILARALARTHADNCLWYLDRPVSNSGRLKTLILQIARDGRLPWDVELVANPDPILACAPHTVVTSDSIILNDCKSWYNLMDQIIANHLENIFLVDLSTS